MATLNDVYYARTLEEKENKVDPGIKNAGVKHLNFKYTFVADAVTSGDEILGLSLPKGALIVDALLHIKGDLGSGGQFTLGLKATTNEAGETVSADADSLVSAVDAGGQAALGRMAAGQAAHGLRLGSEAQVYARCSETADSADGEVIEGWVAYVID